MSGARPPSPPRQPFPLRHHLATLWRHRLMLAGLCAISLGVTAVLTARAPRIYEAIGSVLAPKESGPTGFLAGLAASGAQGLPGLTTGSATPNRDMLISILRSRTMAEAVAAKFGLQQRYGTRFREDTIGQLQQVTHLNISREGVITVAVEDTDPAVAAAMVNFYLAHLDFLVARHSINDAGRQRVFVMEQYARAKSDLEEAEDALRRFQEKNRAVVLQEQTRGAVDAAAKLKGEIMAAEVQRQVLRSFATENNPEMIALDRRIEEMRRQLGQMQYGEDRGQAQRTSTAVDRGEIYVPFARVPEVGLELARLTRQVKMQETLATLLTQQIEQLRITEAKDLPTVQVLDVGVAGERPIRPRLSSNLLTALVASLLLGGALALAIEALGSARLPAA